MNQSFTAGDTSLVVDDLDLIHIQLPWGRLFDLTDGMWRYIMRVTEYYQ